MSHFPVTLVFLICTTLYRVELNIHINRLRYMMGNQAKHVMKEAISVKSNDKLLDALNIMEQTGLEELPVVNNQGVIVGEIHGLEILIETLKLLRYDYTEL